MADRAEKKKRAEAARAARRETWEGFFPPWAAACAGAAISAAFLFQRSIPIRAAMFALFFFAAVRSGKKVSALATALVSGSIVAANLLVPVGRVVAKLGPFAITETALLDGIGKAMVFEGLIYVSKASILPGLRLPGRFGALVAAAFVYYDRIVEYKGGVKPATLIDDVDRLMLTMWESGTAEGGRDAPPVRLRMKPGAAALLAGVVAASYALLLVR